MEYSILKEIFFTHIMRSDENDILLSYREIIFFLKTFDKGDKNVILSIIWGVL